MPSVDALSAGAAGALAAGAGAVISQIIQAIRHRGRDRSDEEAQMVSTAREVVAMLRTELHDQEVRHREEMTRLREQLADAQAQAKAARAEAEAAQAEITELKRALAVAGAAGTAHSEP